MRCERRSSSVVLLIEVAIVQMRLHREGRPRPFGIAPRPAIHPLAKFPDSL